MSTIKTSIKIKKLWYSVIPAGGGLGVEWKEVQQGLREGTVSFAGSDADKTDFKNILGSVLETDYQKGAKTINFQLADLTPEVIAVFSGGTVTTSTNVTSYDAPANENAGIELSITYLTNRGVYVRIPRVSFDGYPTMNDDDLHYWQINGSVLLPADTTVTSFGMDILDSVAQAKNDITGFAVEGKTVTNLVIPPGAHTVTLKVPAGSDLTTLKPVIAVDLGASCVGNAVVTNFTNPVVYSVEAADGTKQNWTVTITLAA